MKTLCSVLALMLLVASAAHADDEVFKYPATGRVLLETMLVEPSRALSKAQVLQARFTHRKFLSEIPQPLTSSGEFVFLRDVGVFWHTQQPFDSVFILTQQGILQRDEGAETLRLSADTQPAVRVIANIFFALFTLDVAALNASFDLYGQKQGDKWSIGLKPKSAAVAGVFKQAIVSGGASVEQVVLMDKRGDRTVIDMNAVTYATAVPASVRALFKR
jgi:hypothetical protein